MKFAFPTRDAGRAAFTLVEVILAIVIALGILVVLLYFYQQATNLRAQALQETERIAAARLLMERITAELRAAQSEVGFSRAFVGQSNSIEFVKAEVPSFTAWSGGALGRSAFPVSDLKRVRYRLVMAEDGTNISGVARTEEPVVPGQQTAPAEDTEPMRAVTNSTTRLNVVEEIRFLQFRFWGGTNWQDSWAGGGTPAGVEVSLGAEPMTSLESTNEYTGDLFRRVIALAVNSGIQSADVGKRATNSAAVEEAP